MWKLKNIYRNKKYTKKVKLYNMEEIVLKKREIEAKLEEVSLLDI